MATIFRNTAAFVAAYICLLIPTYILPYLGSNSSILNLVNAGLLGGFMPQWWWHVGALGLLIVLAWARGLWMGKAYLVIFPVLAALFDMVPGFSSIPLVPTVMHLLAIILGVMGVAPASPNPDAELEAKTKKKRDSFGNKAGFAALLVAAISICGSIWSFTQVKNRAAAASKSNVLSNKIFRPTNPYPAQTTAPLTPPAPSKAVEIAKPEPIKSVPEASKAVAQEIKPKPPEPQSIIKPKPLPATQTVTRNSNANKSSNSNGEIVRQQSSESNQPMPQPVAPVTAPAQSKPVVRYIDINN